MAEWFKRGTVNTFNRGSNPLKAFIILKQRTIYNKLKKVFKKIVFVY